MTIPARSHYFEVELKKHDGMYCFVVPFDVREAFGTKGPVSVRGTIDDYPFRGSIAPLNGGRHYMIVNRDIREEIDAAAGDVICVEMELDIER